MQSRRADTPVRPCAKHENNLFVESLTATPVTAMPPLRTRVSALQARVSELPSLDARKIRLVRPCPRWRSSILHRVCGKRSRHST